MKVSFLYGGVGNQLFQYFALYGTGVEFKISDLFLQGYRTQSSSIGNLLQIPEKHYHKQHYCWFISVALKWGVFILSRFHLGRKTFGIATDGDDINTTDFRFMFGYWQNVNFLLAKREEIQGANWRHGVGDLSADLLDIVTSENTLVVHVRKGDYLLRKNQRIFADLSVNFYLAGILHLKGKYERVVVCTDDPGWVEDNLKKALEEIGLSVELSRDLGAESWEDDFLIMRFSANLLISNSTFAWWAAFLNDSGVIFFPKKWFVDRECYLKLSEWRTFG